MRRLADLRSVTAFRLRQQPSDPLEHVRVGYALMRAHLEHLADHDQATRARIVSEDGSIYCFRPHTALRRVLDHALDHLNQLEQWLAWRTHGSVSTPTDGWASSEDELDEDALPLSPTDLKNWLWRIDIVWHMLAERAARLSADELGWSPPGDEWNVSRMLQHVATGFYVVWLDEALPEQASARYEHASRRLRERLRQVPSSRWASTRRITRSGRSP